MINLEFDENIQEKLYPIIEFAALISVKRQLSEIRNYLPNLSQDDKYASDIANYYVKYIGSPQIAHSIKLIYEYTNQFNDLDKYIETIEIIKIYPELEYGSSENLQSIENLIYELADLYQKNNNFAFDIAQSTKDKNFENTFVCNMFKNMQEDEASFLVKSLVSKDKDPINKILNYENEMINFRKIFIETEPVVVSDKQIVTQVKFRIDNLRKKFLNKIKDNEFLKSIDPKKRIDNAYEEFDQYINQKDVVKKAHSIEDDSEEKIDNAYEEFDQYMNQKNIVKKTQSIKNNSEKNVLNLTEDKNLTKDVVMEDQVNLLNDSLICMSEDCNSVSSDSDSGWSLLGKNEENKEALQSKQLEELEQDLQYEQFLQLGPFGNGPIPPSDYDWPI